MTTKAPKGKSIPSSYYALAHRSNKRNKFIGPKTIVVVVSLLILVVGIPLIVNYAKQRSEADMISLSEMTISEITQKRPKDYGYYYDANDSYRLVVDHDKISKYMLWATVAAEDKDFWNTDRSVLSQKLVYYVYFSDGKNNKNNYSKSDIPRLAAELENMYSKDQIIGMYLNEAPYVESTEFVCGVETGTHVFFGKSAKDLTLAEAAFMAAIPSSQTVLKPHDKNDQKTLIERQHEILDVMADMGYITRDEAEEAKKVDVLSTIKPKLQGESNE